MNIGERVFMRRTQIVLIECVENKTNNVNDVRDRIERETVLIERANLVHATSVAAAIESVTTQ